MGLAEIEELRRKRHRLIAKFLDDNADLLGITPTDDVGDGPFLLTEWCLVLHLRDLSVDDEADDPREIRAAFFRPGMAYSAKIGMIETLKEGVQFPRQLAEDDDD